MTQAQSARKKAAIAFANEQLQQDLDTLDHEQAFNWEGWRACAEHGYMGLPVPIEYGGGGMNILETVLAMEGLGYACRDNGLIFSCSFMGVCDAAAHLRHRGTEGALPAQARQWGMDCGSCREYTHCRLRCVSMNTTAERRGDKFGNTAKLAPRGLPSPPQPPSPNSGRGGET